MRHERVLIGGTVALLGALGWAYLLRGMAMQWMAPPLTALITMWWLMMLAMMLPSATPALFLYARVRETRGDRAIAQPWVFLAGYLAVWLAFSVVAAVIQSRAATPSMALTSRPAQTALLVVAALYQLSPFKSACISQAARRLSSSAGIGGPARLALSGLARSTALIVSAAAGCSWRCSSSGA